MSADIILLGSKKVMVETKTILINKPVNYIEKKKYFGEYCFHHEIFDFFYLTLVFVSLIKPPLFQRNKLTGSGKPTFESYGAENTSRGKLQCTVASNFKLDQDTWLWRTHLFDFIE